jgi:hypothetical protein
LFEFREAGMQVSPVKMSRPSPRTKSLCSTLFTAVYKRLLKEEEGLLPLAFTWGCCLFLGFGFGLGFSTLGFLVGSFWKGKELLKGKEWLKRG